MSRMRHSRRVLRIALTLARYDALDDAASLLPSAAARTLYALTSRLLCKRRLKNLRHGQRLALALEALGPTFIKLGQALSVRPDLVSEAVADDLSGLRDKLPAFPAATARIIIESELGKSIAELFADFNDEPVAAASIAQVHFATLPTGQKVAVKVLRPGIEAAFQRDVALLLWLAEQIEQRFMHYRRLRPADSVRTFAQAVSFELDLRYEAAAATEMRENLKTVTGFYVPKAYWTHTAERVLTTERIEGISLNDMDALKAAGMNLDTLVIHAATAFFHQVFVDGFFHADLHPGNLFVLPDNTLAAVDFGIMGRIDTQTRLYLAEMLWAFLQEDYERVARVHIRAGYVPPSTCVKQFAQANRAIAKPIFGKPLSEISIAQLLRQLFNVAETFQMQAQPHLLMLQKTMMLTEGVGRMLNPQVNMWKVAQPLIEQWVKHHMTAPAKAKAAACETVDILRTAPAMLRRVEQATEALMRGEIALNEQTLAALSGNGKSTRTWLWFAWSALLMLGGILAAVILR